MSDPRPAQRRWDHYVRDMLELAEGENPTPCA